MPYLCEPTFESAATVVRLRSRRHIRDAFTARQARGANGRDIREEKPGRTSDKASSNPDSKQVSHVESVTDDDVHTLLSALTQKNHARAYPGLINVWITLLQECRTVCGDGKAAALAMALFLGVGDSRSKQRRQTPFAVLANYRMTSVTSDEEKTNKWLRSLRRELANTLAHRCETSKQVWRSCLNLERFEGSHMDDMNECTHQQKTGNERLLRIATIDAATSQNKNSKISATYLLKGSVWFTVSTSS